MTDYSTVEEFEKMAEAGMSFRDILASLTTTAGCATCARYAHRESGRRV